MNKQQFIEYIKTPENLNYQSIKLFEKLATDFPFCQTIKLLYVLNLFKENHFQYDNQLKIAAAYASDRKVLKKHIDALSNLEEIKYDLPDEYSSKEKKEEKIKEEATAEKKKRNKLYELNLSDYSIEETTDLTKEEEKIKHLKQIIEKRLTDIQKEKHRRKTTTIKKEYERKDKESDEDTSNLKKHEDLIDKFIKEKPTIKSPKQVFFDPEEYAQKSIVDEENIVSETLAKIYHDQGLYQKAKIIYIKLSLKFPEKSSYFAKKIKELDEEIKNLKKK